MKSSMYSDFSRDYDQVIQNNAYNAHYERPSLQRLFPELSGKRVLDIGCGSGLHSEYLLSQGATVTGIDASEEMILLYKERLASKANSYVHDLNLPLNNEKDNSYDLVIAPLVIHYIEDLDKLFMEVSRVLKEDGEFIFSTHHPFVDFADSNSGNYFERELLVQDWDTVGKPVKVSFYRRSLSELFGALKRAKFVVLDFSEGEPLKELEDIAPKQYERLKTKPNFIFLRARKY